MIDCGANVDARSSHLVQFAKMGSIYMENVVGSESRVAIVNNGAEEEKGNALVKETFRCSKNAEELTLSAVSKRGISQTAYADVIVCELRGKRDSEVVRRSREYSDSQIKQG